MKLKFIFIRRDGYWTKVKFLEKSVHPSYIFDLMIMLPHFHILYHHAYT